MSQPDASLEAAIRAVASEAAPQLWRQALDEARAEVRDELRRRLTAELWAQLGQGAGDETPVEPEPAPAEVAEPESAPAEVVDPDPARANVVEPKPEPAPAEVVDPEPARATIVEPTDEPAPATVVTAPPGPEAADVRTDADEGSPVAGLYLYGFTHADEAAVTGLTGVDGAVTFTIAHGPISAVVSETRGARHGWGVGGDGEPDLEDLAPRLRQHEHVLQQALAKGGVLPVRFGTLYPTREAILDVLRSRSDAVDAALRALDGKAEWGLTVRWDPRRLQEQDPTIPAGAPDAAAPSGRAYLDQVARDRAEAERAAEHRRQLCDVLHQAFIAAAADGVVLPPRRGQEDEVLMRASYLVADAGREQFQETAAAQLAAHAELDLSGDLTGPWPPYHFAQLELEGASA